MSNPYYPRVQQKLAHARLLSQRTQLESDRQMKEALMQGALVHLAAAARLYLREVAHYLSIKSPERIFQVGDLQDLADDTTVVAELKEQDWLPSLFAAERDVLNPRVESAAGPQLIAGSGANESVEVTPERMQGFLVALTRLVEQQRLLFAEY